MTVGEFVDAAPEFNSALALAEVMGIMVSWPWPGAADLRLSVRHLGVVIIRYHRTPWRSPTVLRHGKVTNMSDVVHLRIGEDDDA